jgi:hypothetical protein
MVNSACVFGLEISCRNRKAWRGFHIDIPVGVYFVFNYKVPLIRLLMFVVCSIYFYVSVLAQT